MTFEKRALDRFFGTMREREAIRLKREAGDPPPWTYDIIFQQYRFCNVNREHDKVTRWIEENIRKPHRHDELVWFRLAIARYINYVPTLEKVLPLINDLWQPDKLIEEINAIKGKAWNSAYTFRADGGKAETVVNAYLGQLWVERESITQAFRFGQAQIAWKKLKSFYGLGGFMAYEVVTDCYYTNLLVCAHDRFTWAYPGPGAKRGLLRLKGVRDPRKSKISDTEATGLLMDVYQIGRERCPDLVIEPRTIEHWLCEFDKYERVRNDQGDRSLKLNRSKLYESN